MMNSLVGINEIAERIERLKNSLKKEIRVSEDDVPRGGASRNKANMQRLLNLPY